MSLRYIAKTLYYYEVIKYTEKEQLFLDYHEPRKYSHKKQNSTDYQYKSLESPYCDSQLWI